MEHGGVGFDLLIRGPRLPGAGRGGPTVDIGVSGGRFDAVATRLADANALPRLGVLCSVSPNNMPNPLTPMGDGQPIRQANLHANTAQRAAPEELDDFRAMFTANSARLTRRQDYGTAPGDPADFVLVDALRETSPTLGAWKRGRRSFTRGAPVLHRP